MRLHRFVAVFLLLILMLSAITVIAQESTAEPEATEEITPEATEEMTPEATQAPDDSAEATEAADDTSSSDDESADDGTYTVQRGDNLFRIALRFGLSTKQLAEANGIANPALIFAGQRLVIPGKGSDVTTAPTSTPEPADESNDTTAPAPDNEDEATVVYVVQPGDTLYRVAIRNSTTIARLVELNNIANANLIFVGQRLTVSGTAARSSDTSSDAGTETGTSTEPQPIEGVEFGTGVEVFLGQDINAVSSQTAQLGVDWVKITVDWRQVEATQGELELGAIDQAVEIFNGAGMKIILTLIGTPAWATPSATDLALAQNASIPPDDLNDFGTFAGAIAQHYQGQVAAYEIWSEPNLRINWMTPNVTLRSDDRPDARLANVRYIDLLEVAYAAIKENDPSAIVVTAGLAPTGFNDFYNAIDTFVFFEALLGQGALNFSDAIGVHIDGFANPPDASCCGTGDDEIPFNESYHFFFADMLDNYREILNRSGGSDAPIFVTRFGWGTSENASGTPQPINQDYLTANSADQQAQYTVDAFSAAHARGDIGAMILFNLNGCAVGNTNACYYSVVGADVSARPLFAAVQNMDMSASGSGG